MVESLTKILIHFPGAANRARCTAHIVNLVSKIILRQFDAKKETKGTPKKPEASNDKANDEPTNGIGQMEVTEQEDDKKLTSLAEGLDREEQELADDEDDEMTENITSDLKEIEEAMKEEILEVWKKVKPIQRVLFKVRSILFPYSLFILLMYLTFFCIQLRKLAYVIKRSSTKLLPRWKEILEELATVAATTNKKPLSIRIMPRDVSTR